MEDRIEELELEEKLLVEMLQEANDKFNETRKRLFVTRKELFMLLESKNEKGQMAQKET
jgi:hypothetical protein